MVSARGGRNEEGRAPLETGEIGSVRGQCGIIIPI